MYALTHHDKYLQQHAGEMLAAWHPAIVDPSTIAQWRCD